MVKTGGSLALIHFIAGVGTADVVLTHFFHECADLAFALLTGGDLGEPIAEEGVEGGIASARFLAGFPDEAFVGAECDVFHNTKIVHTSLVCKGIRQRFWVVKRSVP